MIVTLLYSSSSGPRMRAYCSSGSFMISSKREGTHYYNNYQQQPTSFDRIDDDEEKSSQFAWFHPPVIDINIVCYSQ